MLRCHPVPDLPWMEFMVEAVLFSTAQTTQTGQTVGHEVALEPVPRFLRSATSSYCDPFKVTAKPVPQKGSKAVRPYALPWSAAC